jgi:hypothetical protein
MLVCTPFVTRCALGRASLRAVRRACARAALPVLVGFYYIAATLMSHPMEHDGHCHFNVLRVFALRAVVAGADSRSYLQHLWWWATVVGALCGALIDLLLFDRHFCHRCELVAGCDDGSSSATPAKAALGVKTMRLGVQTSEATTESAELQVEMPALDGVQQHVESRGDDAARGAVRIDERLA